jgi:Tfp pilus assembly protein PilW
MGGDDTMAQPSRCSGEGGFSTVELLAATLLTVIVVGAALGLMNPQALAARIQPDVVDAEQRLRVGVDVLLRDLYVAGAGMDSGTLAGPLGVHLPAVIPRRIGLRFSDAPGVALADAVTLLHVPSSSSQSALASPLTSSTASLLALAGCSLGQAACGFNIGDGLMLFDDQGHFDLFTVLSTTGADATLRHRGQQGAYPFPAGTHAAEAELRIYYFDAASRQLRFSDGDNTDQPVIDGISQLSLEYFGRATPPRAPKPPLGVANCLYDAAGVPEPALATLPAGPDGLAALPLTLLSDGPWCGVGDTRFDADLLRIRRVRVTIAVSAASRSPGIRDPAVTFDVAPRNLADQP